MYLYVSSTVSLTLLAEKFALRLLTRVFTCACVCVARVSCETLHRWYGWYSRNRKEVRGLGKT